MTKTNDGGQANILITECPNCKLKVAFQKVFKIGCDPDGIPYEDFSIWECPECGANIFQSDEGKDSRKE